MTARQKAALESSERAATLNPKEAAFLNTRGIAFYRAGDYEGAILQLGQSVAMSPKGGYSEDFLFLALANEQLGRNEEAERWKTRWHSRIAQPADPQNGGDAAEVAAKRPWPDRLCEEPLRRETADWKFP